MKAPNGATLASLNCLAQCGGELVLLVNGLEDRCTTLFQSPAAVQGIAKCPDLYLVQTPGDFLAVAPDEGNGGARIEELCDTPSLLAMNTGCVGRPLVQLFHFSSVGRTFSRL